MLKRDFTKSNKEYFAKNKITLIIVAVFLLLGIILGACLGVNGNFEINGYYEFKVEVNQEKSSVYNDYTKEIASIVNAHDGNFDAVSIFDEGDNTVLIVRYENELSATEKAKINSEVAEKLSLESDFVSEHKFVSPVLKSRDIVYTVTAILLLVTLASIFAYFRYNGASAMAIILSCLFGTLAFMSFGTILRLTVGMSYFAMLVILNMLIVYFALEIFENIREENWLANSEYEKAIDSSMKASRFRMALISVAVLLIGIMFIVLAPTPLKYVSQNIMFMAVTILAVGWYVIPFVWSVFITRCRKKEYKVKATTVKDIEDKD